MKKTQLLLLVKLVAISQFLLLVQAAMLLRMQLLRLLVFQLSSSLMQMNIHTGLLKMLRRLFLALPATIAIFWRRQRLTVKILCRALQP